VVVVVVLVLGDDLAGVGLVDDQDVVGHLPAEAAGHTLAVRSSSASGAR
jgi:hypothetical protein